MDVGSDFLVFPPLEVIPAAGFYDEQTKLNPTGDQLPTYVFPKDLLDDDGGFIQKRAYDIFKRIGGKNYGRVDFILDKMNTPWALEVNTIPALSRSGNFTTCGNQVGFTYDELTIALLRSCLSEEHFPAPCPTATPISPVRNNRLGQLKPG